MPLKTYGDLRQQLKTEGLAWTVNPALTDNLLIKRPPLGADVKQLTLAKDTPAVNVAALVKAQPTTNTLLRAHLVKRGFLTEIAEKIGGSSQVVAAHHPAAAGASGSNPPASVDWRNRWTWNFVTSIRDQDPCEHCWIYASTALVECMVRIEHCVWCDRSEGDYIEANKVPCGQCGSAPPVLDWFAANGVCDQSTVSWVDVTAGNHSGTYFNPGPGSCGGGSMQAPTAYNPPSNRDGKTVKIPKYTSLGSVADQKNWIDAVGPLVVGFDVYSDFFGWSGTKPYVKSSQATFDGGHVMLAVGYDDTLQCWICKNSWGTGYGNQGFYLIGYGQCNIDYYTKYGVQYTNPDPWTKRRSHAGGMIESGDGALHRNFELLAPSKGNTLTHWWRDNSSGSLPWAKAETMANDVSGAITFTGTTFNRNFEAIYRTTGSRLHHWWFDQATQKWNNGPIFGPTNAIGHPGFCESNYGQGNFEAVTAVSGGAVEHWWRAGATWAKSASFGSGVLTTGHSLVETTWNNLDFVATLSNGKLQHWCRQGANWTALAEFGAGISSCACMIQGQFGANTDAANGNYELLVAMPNGTVQHWWRNNQVNGNPWVFGATFGSGVKEVVALLQGSFGFNLEAVVLRTDGQLQHYWRDDGGWHADTKNIGTTL